MAVVEKQKSLESWLWDAACSIRGAREAAKYKDFILPLVFAKRLADVYDDEINRIARNVGSRAKAFKMVEYDKSLVRFYLPFVPENPDEPVWSVIRTISDKIGEEVTTKLREIARFNPLLNGIIDRVDFNATTHGERDLTDDRLSNLIEKISEKRLGLKDVEPDIIGRSYEYLIRKFAEGGGQSAGEFYTPTEVGMLIARIIDPEPGQTIYDPCCGSAGLLIKCQMVLEEKLDEIGTRTAQPLGIYGKELTPVTWAMANMNMIIHNMEGDIEIGDPFLVAMAERARAIQEQYEDRQLATREALQALIGEVENDQERQRRQAERGLDDITYFLMQKFLEEDVPNAIQVAEKAGQAFVEHPYWRISEAEMRHARQDVTFAIYFEDDDMEKVARIVDEVFSVLQKATAGVS